MVQKAEEAEATATAKAFAAFAKERFPEVLTMTIPKGSAYASTKASADEPTVTSGTKLVGGAKYADKTYAEVYESDQTYCRFVVERALSQVDVSGGWEWPFIAYVQHRWLMGGSLPGEMFKLTAASGCLDGASFAITGLPTELKRNHLEEMIFFFGGVVRTSVSSKTTYLIQAGKNIDGKSADSGAKYSKALEHGTHIISVQELINDLKGTSGEGQQVTFSTGSS